MFASFAAARRGRVASTRGASLIPCRWDLCCEGVARVPCVALCHGDCCWAGRVGAALPWGSASRACTACGAVPLGSATRARRACTMGATVPLGSALRARRACTVCGAVPWGLLLGRSCGRRSAVGICVSGCAMGIAAVS